MIKRKYSNNIKKNITTNIKSDQVFNEKALVKQVDKIINLKKRKPIDTTNLLNKSNAD